MIAPAIVFAFGLVAPAMAATSSTPTVSVFMLDVPSPLPTINARIVSADGTNTFYQMGCTPVAGGKTGEDPCSLIDQADVVVGPTIFSLKLSRETERISVTGGTGIFTPEYFTTTTASVSCAIGSNTASCTGYMSATTTNRGNGGSHSSNIAQVYKDVTGSAVPVTITAGAAFMEKTTTTTKKGTTSSSQGGAPKATPQAIMAGVAAIIGGIAIL